MSLDFCREVVEKKSEEFKINCLKGIATLFPTDYNPFYAGYGNKINVSDAILLVGLIIYFNKTEKVTFSVQGSFYNNDYYTIIFLTQI